MAELERIITDLKQAAIRNIPINRTLPEIGQRVIGNAERLVGEIQGSAKQIQYPTIATITAAAIDPVFERFESLRARSQTDSSPEGQFLYSNLIQLYPAITALQMQAVGTVGNMIGSINTLRAQANVDPTLDLVGADPAKLRYVAENRTALILDNQQLVDHIVREVKTGIGAKGGRYKGLTHFAQMLTLDVPEVVSGAFNHEFAACLRRGTTSISKAEPDPWVKILTPGQDTLHSYLAATKWVRDNGKPYIHGGKALIPNHQDYADGSLKAAIDRLYGSPLTQNVKQQAAFADQVCFNSHMTKVPQFLHRFSPNPEPIRGVVGYFGLTDAFKEAAGIFEHLAKYPNLSDHYKPELLKIASGLKAAAWGNNYALGQRELKPITTSVAL